jgi:ATP-dependent RNA helicase RhlE
VHCTNNAELPLKARASGWSKLGNSYLSFTIGSVIVRSVLAHIGLRLTTAPHSVLAVTPKNPSLDRAKREYIFAVSHSGQTVLPSKNQEQLNMLFKDLGLTAELLSAVEKKGYDEATPIQQQAIPLILEGKDVLAGAQTGTGKTAGFTLPLLQKLQKAHNEGEKSYPKVLVLTPTRELAAQVHESVRDYGRFLPFRTAVIFGGVSINPQKQKLIKGVDIVVATPGRLLDHLQQKSINLSKVEILVLDEADRMLDMGFIRDIRKILNAIPKQRQTLLFSATFSREIKGLASEFLNNPSEIQVTPENTATELVSQVVYPVDKGRKRELLSHKIGEENWQQVLVFTRTKHGANKLAEQLGKDGIKSAAIHGNKSQGARTKALADFKGGAVRVLVATDIAARGIDIDKLPHVVNFELPNVAEDYVHRIGRTARAGQQGSAVSLVCVDELKLLRDIEKVLGKNIEKVNLPGYDVDPSIKAEPIQNGRGGGGGRNNSGGGGRGRNTNASRGRNHAGGGGGRSSGSGRNENSRARTSNGNR